MNMIVYVSYHDFKTINTASLFSKSTSAVRYLSVWGVSVCVWSYRSTIDVKVDTYGCGLGEDVANLRFELGVENSAVETEQVLVIFKICILYSIVSLLLTPKQKEIVLHFCSFLTLYKERPVFPWHPLYFNHDLAFCITPIVLFDLMIGCSRFLLEVKEFWPSQKPCSTLAPLNASSVHSLHFVSLKRIQTTYRRCPSFEMSHSKPDKP